MTKYIIFAVLLVVITVVFASCVFKPEQPEPESFGEPLKLKEFSFSHSGTSVEDIYFFTLTVQEEGLHFYAELNAGQNTTDTYIDGSALDELGVIAGKYRLDEWDGFDKTNSDVLDGSGFSLSMTLADGRTVSARGSNATPKRYGEAYGEICRVFDLLVYEYSDLYPKTLASDDLCYFDLTVNPNGYGTNPTFSVRADLTENGGAEISIKFTDIDEYSAEENYRFSGKCEGFPFGEIQALVRKYNVPAWNGLDAEAGDSANAEWFRLEMDYESDEEISAMGTVHPEGYEGFRSEIFTLIINFVRENGDSFIAE